MCGQAAGLSKRLGASEPHLAAQRRLVPSRGTSTGLSSSLRIEASPFGCIVSPVVPAPTFGKLFDCRSTRVIVIRDYWDGLSRHAPVVALYELHRDRRGGFSGDGFLSARTVGQHSVRLSLRASTASRFFEEIAAARLSPGEPHQDEVWTDDFPKIDIALHAGNCDDGGDVRLAVLFTESQARYHVPWGARVEGNVWTISGEEIGRTFARLRRSLKRPMLDRLMREADEAGRGDTD